MQTPRRSTSAARPQAITPRNSMPPQGRISVTPGRRSTRGRTSVAGGRSSTRSMSAASVERRRQSTPLHEPRRVTQKFEDRQPAQSPSGMGKRMVKGTAEDRAREQAERSHRARLARSSRPQAARGASSPQRRTPLTRTFAAAAQAKTTPAATLASTAAAAATAASPAATATASTKVNSLRVLRDKRKRELLEARSNDDMDASQMLPRMSLQARRDEMKLRKQGLTSEDHQDRYDDLLQHVKRPRFSVLPENMDAMVTSDSGEGSP
ncbi:hypothetical protein DIPPA_18412 [Diplonema papillatum]|nr:hypothetical protein DIPPA_18412 [Diplonema papillatum]